MCTFSLHQLDVYLTQKVQNTETYLLFSIARTLFALSFEAVV